MGRISSTVYAEACSTLHSVLSSKNPSAVPVGAILTAHGVSQMLGTVLREQGWITGTRARSRWAEDRGPMSVEDVEAVILAVRARHDVTRAPRCPDHDAPPRQGSVLDLAVVPETSASSEELQAAIDEWRALREMGNDWEARALSLLCAREAAAPLKEVSNG